MSYFGIPIRNGIGIGLRSYVGLESKTPAWTPAQLSTALWLDAADSSTITLNGSTVSQWNDKSGNGRNAAQATASSQPQYFQYQNYLVYSDQFNDALWAKTGNAVTSNATTAPNGTVSADLLVEDTSTGGHNVSQDIAGFPDNTTYTASAYVKPNGRSWVAVAFMDKTGQNNRVWYNITTGTQGTTNGTVTAFSAVDVGNGWYRLAVSASTSTGASSPGLRISMGSADNTALYTGNGSSGVYVWGAQVSLGALQPYQLTTSVASLTGGLNNKPALSFDGTNDSLDFPTGFLFNQSQFTVAMVQRASAQNNNALFGPSTSNFAGLEMIFNSVISSPTLVRINNTQKFITGLWDVANVGGVSTLTASSSATSGTFNGTNITPTSGTGIAALNFNGVYSLGRYQSNLYGATTMCEFIITPNSLTTIGRQQIEGYLAWKWGGF